MAKTKGRVTLPSEGGFLNETKEIMERWGADALRDSDGTKLPEEIKSLDAAIYTTYFVARGHNEFAEKHMEECQQLYLMSKRVTAVEEQVEISFMDGYFHQQVKPDYYHDCKKWWEVIDRTLGEVVLASDWELDQKRNIVTIRNGKPFHEYTVSFLVYAIWDPTQMYNHITNQWGDRPHEIPFDVRQPCSWKFAKDYLVQWLKENPRTDVVRFTTFFYHFTLVFNEQAKEKFVDWFGYGATVSVKALEEFEQEYGYRLRPEDIVDNGYYNSTFRIPSKHYLDYMDFIQRFVAKKAGELIKLVHEEDREAMMFLGDNWIGTEPYGPYFPEIGLDAVVGSVGGGATLRLISDIPGVRYTEGRFLPYFFPDTFYPGNNPCLEAEENWLCARRAMMRKPLDRIGYGGYLSLACKFPEFVDYIEQVTDEFRELYENIGGSKPYCGLTVGILNCWGKLRSWQAFMVAHALWYQQTYSYFGVLEALSGAAVNVVFLSFEDIRKKGSLDGIDVLINAGAAGTAFSGGEEWLDETVLTEIRRFVYNGGGFVGVGEPSAIHSGGRFFQLADVLGVDKELGFSLSTDRYWKQEKPGHFLKEDENRGFSFGEGMKDIYSLSEETEIAVYSQGSVQLSANPYGKGRGVYIAGLPYSHENTRLLLRSLYYSAGREADLKLWFAENLWCEVHAYPEKGLYAVVNNSKDPQETIVYDGFGNPETIFMKGKEILWKEMNSKTTK
ncbi:MAG: 1,3-beta-galactosyl-N-acetylhexosamine phosphorylase [Lachnospiraceae bacterium]|jgi:1,3-beta-galactosyl-N-acetylhexosamine phosphorylase|nr:1,3-beta-galactosyl-N-acetylhexosamine phosphorylase [Lachnospiraceae bacterium]